MPKNQTTNNKFLKFKEKFNLKKTSSKILLVVSILILAIISIYLILSHNARYTNTFGKETLTETLETYEIKDQFTFSPLNSKFTLITFDDQNKPVGFETHTLIRTIPNYDPNIEEIRYWKSIEADSGYFPQGTEDLNQVEEYLKTNQSPTKKPTNCAMEEFDYYSICILDNEKRGIDLEKFKGTKVGMSSDELWKYIDYAIDRGGTGGYDGSPSPTNFYEHQYILNESNLNFLVAAFDSRTTDKPDDTAKLQKIYIIKDDKSYIEVPIKENGEFDFETALEEVGK